MNPIVDIIIRIKNAYLTRNESVVSPYSKYRVSVLEKLKKLGYISDFSVSGDVKKTIYIQLKYTDGVPALTDVKIYSTSGNREYISYKDVKSVMSGMGYSIISTSHGILTNRELKKMKLGGELLFAIW
ncbi:30S ribosomal protein S8 [Candidatus Roizmanbacteria bacterium CG_4_10_14_0_8_um_filter_33_9]|uniref:Small ribosomal subunit protein uS8 n=1 Tax=Candidatus Roizmanbacteria bacterium CG_4_10_14_0_8_um_filter_33_9 TaxID=1974826 RepID=A0A2M7QJA0_9BACT|nr:MAG: 30S ribosomal protein S8 [Candidatus Roizmanbacteria bacterium CG_4_10_14_0_8_um_filter_33_9]